MEENKKVVEMGNVEVTGAVDSGKKISIFKKPTKKTLVIVGVAALAAVGTVATVIFKGSKKDEDCTGAVDQDDFDDSYETDDESEDDEDEIKTEEI